MSLFEGKAAKEKKTAVKNVLAVMAADGEIDKKELVFVAQVCKRVGLSDKQLKQIIKSPDKVTFTVAKSMEERVMQLIDMVFMMLADGKVDQREMDLCMTLATRMGFPPSVIPTMIKTLVESVGKGQNRDQVSVDIGSLFDK